MAKASGSIHTNFRKVKKKQDDLCFQKILEKVSSKLLMVGDGPERVKLRAIAEISVFVDHHTRF
jgi:hypothetical protein